MDKDPDAPWEKVKKEKEEEYYARRAGEPIQWLRRKDSEEERRQVRQVCHMRCPSCGQKLEERSFRGGILQVCTECGGLWLDRSEAEVLASLDRPNIFSEILARIQE